MANVNRVGIQSSRVIGLSPQRQQEKYSYKKSNPIYLVTERDRNYGYEISNPLFLTISSTCGPKLLNRWLFCIYSAFNEPRIKNRIIDANQGLVKRCVADYSSYTDIYQDMIQAGMLGLSTAIDKFDYTLGYAFSTYAVPYIKGFIKRLIQKSKQTIYLPAQVVGIKYKISKASRVIQRETGSTPTLSKIKKYLYDTDGISGKKVDLTIKAFKQQPDSLDRQKFRSGGGMSNGLLSDVVAHPDTLKPDYDESDYYIDIVYQHLDELEADVRRAVILHYVNRYTQNEVAERMGIEFSTARNLLNRGMRYLQRNCRATVKLDNHKLNSPKSLIKR